MSLRGLFGRLFASRVAPVERERRDPALRAPQRMSVAERAAVERERAKDGQGRPVRLVPLGEAFTPTQPTSGRRRLVGRQVELRRILQALQEDRAHVVLYSERGRGKTSLANLVVEHLRRAETVVARHTCEANTTFDSLMRGLVGDLPAALLASAAPSRTADGEAALPGGAGEGCEAALPGGALGPRDVVALPRRLACGDLVFVVDEFDRIADPATRTRLADTIKQLSDRDVRLRFLIVGVSENLDQILGQHPSIQRAVVGIHLPLFTDRDVAGLIARGSRETGLAFPQPVVACVTVLARGMPYMAQLLGLRLVQAASERGDTAVSDADLDTAVVRLLEEARPRILALYAELTEHGRDGAMVLALRRLATAQQDPWGRLQVAPMPDGGIAVGGRTIARACWERLEAKAVLQAHTPGSGFYVFAERALMHHVLLLAARDTALPDAPAPAPDLAAADNALADTQADGGAHTMLADGALADGALAGRAGDALEVAHGAGAAAGAVPGAATARRAGRGRGDGTRAAALDLVADTLGETAWRR